MELKVKKTILCVSRLILVIASSFLPSCQSYKAYRAPGAENGSYDLNHLSALEYKVTQEGETEKAFANKFWDHFAPGIYVDVVSGDVLFTSKDKFVSGTGYPAFSAVAVPENIVVNIQSKLLFFSTTELRSKKANSHLGHLYMDGPTPSQKHYCVNSSALKFIPVKELSGRYENQAKLFLSKP